MTDEEYQAIWCDTCGMRMQMDGERMDIINKRKRAILRCLGCRKWEWAE